MHQIRFVQAGVVRTGGFTDRGIGMTNKAYTSKRMGVSESTPLSTGAGVSGL